MMVVEKKSYLILKNRGKAEITGKNKGFYLDQGVATVYFPYSFNQSLNYN